MIDLTVEQAREILAVPGYDAYGSVRLYCVYGKHSQFAGQIGSIKSEWQLNDLQCEGFDRLYMIERSEVPIKKA